MSLTGRAAMLRARAIRAGFEPLTLVIGLEEDQMLQDVLGIRYTKCAGLPVRRLPVSSYLALEVR